MDSVPPHQGVWKQAGVRRPSADKIRTLPRYPAQMDEFLQVTTATPDLESATRLAESAVRARLAAGAQVAGPLTTAFWHLGEFGTGQEWTVTMPTTAAMWEALQAHLTEAHPWDNPQVSAIALVEGSPSYLEWIRTSVGEPAS
jgi:periplasmic divalent cation tolerance protein